MLFRSADAEASRNNMKRAIALIREALDLTPANQRGRRLVGQARLARFLAQAGDVDAAEQVLDEAEDQADAVGDRSGRQRRQGQRQGGQNPSNRRPGATGPALGRGGGLQAASSPIQRALQREIPMAEVAIAMMRGRYEQAESVQRAMMAQLPSDGDAETATLRRGLATILRFQGRLAEAETEARAALVGMQKRFGVNSVNTATALLALASILSDQGRNVEAETLARKGLELVRATGRNGAGARVALANILVAQGRWAEAVTEFTALRQGFADDDSGFNALLPVNLNLPLALLKTGQVAEALARFKTLADTREKSMGDKHYATAEARGFHALALAASGDRKSTRLNSSHT